MFIGFLQSKKRCPAHEYDAASSNITAVPNKGKSLTSSSKIHTDISIDCGRFSETLPNFGKAT
jgi:hypothetical protein